MNAVSMTTNALRDILDRMGAGDLGFRVLVASDISGPGGRVFIAAHTELSERHLSWLEQRNPAPNAPTYVDVLFSQKRPSAVLENQFDLSAEAPEAAGQRRQRAAAMSRQVGKRAEAVARQAREVYQIVGIGAFTPAALRSRKVQDKLRDLDERLQHFDRAVRAALDDYLVGNTLIMDLWLAQLGQFQIGPDKRFLGRVFSQVKIPQQRVGVIHGHVLKAPDQVAVGV